MTFTFSKTTLDVIIARLRSLSITIYWLIHWTIHKGSNWINFIPFLIYSVNSGWIRRNNNLRFDYKIKYFGFLVKFEETPITWCTCLATSCPMHNCIVCLSSFSIKLLSIWQVISLANCGCACKSHINNALRSNNVTLIWQTLLKTE